MLITQPNIVTVERRSFDRTTNSIELVDRRNQKPLEFKRMVEFQNS